MITKVLQCRQKAVKSFPLHHEMTGALSGHLLLPAIHRALFCPVFYINKQEAATLPPDQGVGLHMPHRPEGAMTTRTKGNTMVL